MDVFTSAAELLRHHRPERPVLALRPHAAARAGALVPRQFPGRVLYAAKANDAVPVIAALGRGGNHRLSTSRRWSRSSAWRRCPNAELYYMNPVKSRGVDPRAPIASSASAASPSTARMSSTRSSRRPAARRTSSLYPAHRLPQYPQPYSARGQVRRAQRRKRRRCCCARAKSPTASASPSMWARRRWCLLPSARRCARWAS